MQANAAKVALLLLLVLTRVNAAKITDLWRLDNMPVSAARAFPIIVLVAVVQWRLVCMPVSAANNIMPLLLVAMLVMTAKDSVQ
jgi:hypothetical protein